MEIVEAINPRDNVKEFIEEKLKKAVKEVTPYKKQLVQNNKITRFLNQHTISSIGNIVYLDLVSPETKHKLLKNKTDKYMHLGIILIGIIGLHRKEIGALININLLDTRNNTVGRALLASAEVNMNQNYAVIGCIPQFCIDLKEFTEKIKITVNTKGYDMELGSKNLSIAIGFIGKTTNALSLKCMMEFDDIVKTFGSKTVNMIEAKPVNIDYLLGREWELPQINKPIIKYPTSSSLYENQDGSASITFGNYKTVNVEVESDSEIETVNVIQEDILLNIETVENLYKNSELVNIMLEEFSNPTLLNEQVDQENFVNIMCNNYTDDQIIEQLYKTNLIKKLIDIEMINQFTIQPKANENIEIISNESINTINEEKESVNVKSEIVKYNKPYSKPKGPQWKTKTEPSSSLQPVYNSLQPVYEYGTILDIDSAQDLRKTIENWEQSLNSAGVVVSFENQQEIYEFCKSTLRGTVLQFFRNMEQENSSYFQEVRNNFSISVFINLIKLYFLGTTQEDVKEP